MMTARNAVIGVAMNTGKWKQGDVIYYNSFQFLQLVLCSILLHSWFDAKVLDIVHKWQLYCRQYESSKLGFVVVTNGHLIMLQTKETNTYLNHVVLLHSLDLSTLCH